MNLEQSVIVGDLHVVRMPISPDEADAILVIDTDAPLAFAIAFESFKVIVRWYRKGFQRSGRV
jgi:hypothetical protein